MTSPHTHPSGRAVTSRRREHRPESVAAALAVAVLLSSCSAPRAAARPGAAADFTGCVLGSSGGFGDRSFNQDIHESSQVLEASLGIDVRTEESDSPREAEQLLQEMADPANGCDLVVAMGSTLVEQVDAAAEQHPDQDFAIIDDDSIDRPNVRTLVFDASQPGFLAGYAAASVTESGRVGAFGGEDIPEVHDFLDGYAAGIAHWNQVHDDDVQLIGWDPRKRTGDFVGDFARTEAAAALTRRQLDDGADVIMPVAGRAGLGATETIAQDDDALFVWVDMDGWDVLPDEQRTRQLTSVLKEVGYAVADVMTQYASPGVEAEDYSGTLANRGVALGDFHDQADRVDEQTAQELRQLRQRIIEDRQPTRPGAGT
ncbi:BMP family ABC transporter substrate-binding protein [Kocuria sp. p3-SID1433]|uniref:BMP family ABC transporter substrate-binding protein n=2 Tax=unclassified Kocuria TaxID=2649579 RepID=UPI0021A8EF43|nr:BMP family ABC transporter substrate-binding protein [Kocuria sp. p3-SID1433]MCT2179517.1 BMP family ABC transporter substrate-binding protein [Kocuria sp. p3-SID1433]